MADWHNLAKLLTSNLLQASVSVTFLTILVRSVWAFGSWLGRSVSFNLNPVVHRIVVDLTDLRSADHPIDVSGVTLFCQVVRFGADTYLKDLASEQEKSEGRLQNRVIPIDLQDDGCSLTGTLLIPIHRRLGTQFRMFIIAASDDQARALRGSELFKNSETYPSGPRGRRISFALPNVQSLSNAENQSRNNIVYPSHVTGFTRWSQHGWWYRKMLKWRDRQ